MSAPQQTPRGALVAALVIAIGLAACVCGALAVPGWAGLS